MPARMRPKGTPTVDELAAGANPPAFFPYPGMTVERVDDEHAVVRMDTPSGLMSPDGPVHGDIAALTDTAIAVAAGRHLADDERTATHQLNLNYISIADEPRVRSIGLTSVSRPARGSAPPSGFASRKPTAQQRAIILTPANPDGGCAPW
jgi:uncharacterized protein (TIGR00369 family)